MSKVGKSTGPMAAADLSRVTRTTAALQQLVPHPPPPPTKPTAPAAPGKSIVSIEVNMVETVKKKRLALGNISNADPAQPSAAAAAPKDAKKYRFGGANIVNIASVMPGFNKKPAEPAVQLPKKTSSKSSSKENLIQGAMPVRKPVASKRVEPTALSKNAVSKSENDIKRQVDSLSLAVEVSSSSSSMSLVSTGVVATTSNVPNVPSIDQVASRAQQLPARPDLVPGWDDMDIADSGDEFTCAEYASSIFKYYRQREGVFQVRDYLSAPTANINRQMRFLLVDWMVEVQQQLEFNHEVLYLSVKLLDLYLTRQLVDKERLQLLAAASMFIACKFEERMPPVIDDFILVSDNAYARKDMIRMEIEILKMVRFDLGVPLSYTFLRRYSKCVRADMRFLTLARYILELSLQDYAFAAERDSLKACAALYLAMKMAVAYETHVSTRHHVSAIDSPPMLYVSTTNLTSTEWNPTLIHYTDAFVQDFVHLIMPMNNMVKSAPTSKYKTIFRKYSHPVFFEVAKVPALSDFQVELIINSNEMVH